METSSITVTVDGKKYIVVRQELNMDSEISKALSSCDRVCDELRDLQQEILENKYHYEMREHARISYQSRIYDLVKQYVIKRDEIKLDEEGNIDGK
jgi:hypothetical protein